MGDLEDMQLLYKLLCRCAFESVMLTTSTGIGAGTNTNRCDHSKHAEAAVVCLQPYAFPLLGH